MTRARRDSSSSTEEDKEIESQMLIDMASDDDDVDQLIMEVQQSELCKGCHQKGDGELLWLQCEIYDAWWHKHCTKVAQSLSTEEIERLQFWCNECLPQN